MLQYGSPPSQSKNLDLRYTNVPFKMPWLFDITGRHCKHPLLVPAVQNSPLNMLCHALRVVSPPSDITIIRDLTADLLTEVCSDVCFEPDLQPAGGEELSGSSSNTQDGVRLDIAANGFWVVVLNVPFLMWEFLIPMPLPTEPSAATGSMSWRRSVSMNSEWERLNTPRLLPLFYRQQAVWPVKQLFFTRGLPHAWPPNGTNHIA